MNKKIRQQVCLTIDQLMIFVAEAAKQQMMPQLQSDDIINELLDARHAATTQAPNDPQVPEKVA